jgi:hypothetical protein
LKNKKAAAAVLSIGLILTLAGCNPANTNKAADTVSGSDVTADSGAWLSAVTAVMDTVDVSFDGSDDAIDWRSGSYTTLDMSTGSQTVTKSGTYEITGTLADGSLIIDIDTSTDKGIVNLILNTVSITSETSAPIYVKDADKVVLVLENNTVNTVTQGSGVAVNTENEPSAAVFSKADLTITGGGTLNVVSGYNDGITCKDTLKITDGTLYIEATGDGITGKDVLAVEQADITINAGKDGLRSTNDTDAGMGSILIKDGIFDIHAGGDAIQANSTLQIDGGSFDLTSGGGYAGITNSDTGFGQSGMGAASGDDTNGDAGSDSDSKKCLKATGGIVINGGTILMSSSEDALHSNGGVAIAGGNLTLSAGDDGIHADADVSVTGGSVTIQNSYEGIEGKNITVNNGEISLNSSDDGFNVNDGTGVQAIGGGTVYINAGGDGLDANGSVTMTGGTVYVDGPTNNGNGAIDYQMGFTISGGTLIAAGSSGMAQTPGMKSSQNALLMYYTTPQAAGTAVTVRDESGNTVASFTPAKEYSSAAISAPGLKTGQSYTLFSGETETVTFTLTETVTYLNESGVTTNQGMMPGGQMGGGQHQGGPMGGGKPGMMG